MARVSPELYMKAEKAHVAEVPKTLSGSYLAGRFAQHSQDWDAAQGYMLQALSFDDANDSLRQRAFLLALGTGEDDKAKTLANEILRRDENPELATVYLGIEAFADKDFDTAAALLQELPDDGFGYYTKPLLMAWAFVGQGQPDEALALLTEIKPLTDPVYLFHAGLISQFSDKDDLAHEFYMQAMANGLSLHGALIVGNFMEQRGEKELAQNIYQSVYKQDPHSPYAPEAVSRLENAKSESSMIESASEGAGMALFDLATLLYERRAYDSALIYGRMVHRLQPESPYVNMMLGDIMAIFGNYEEAVTRYNDISRNSELFWLAKLRTAETLELGGRLDDAITMLSDMADKHKERTDVLAFLGDIYRRNEQYQEAVHAYNAALSRVPKLGAEHWALIYARGMSFERIDDWPSAEKDLLQALEFQPNNPMILNYLGYTWADKGKNLEKALDMIKRAAMLRPNDGYILDSYGWALYRVGDYALSVDWLERAIEQVPNDVTINDHLGDAYWMVGRHLEARFQWERAMNLARDEKMKGKIRHKIINGLPGVKKGTIAGKEARLNR